MEVRQFLALMVWAAWLLDWQWWTPTGKAVAHEDASEYGLANARFLGLLSAATEQAGAWSDARAHIDRTIPAIPLEKSAADRWFERHGTIGQQLLTLDLTSETPESGSADEPVVVGDVVSVPNVITAMLVAVSVDASYVEVFTGRGYNRKFLRSRVRKLARI